MFHRLRAAWQEMLARVATNFENLQQSTRHHLMILMEQTNQTIISIGKYLSDQRQKTIHRTQQFIQLIYQNLLSLWQKISRLIQIQNQKIKAIINDFGPYLPDEHIKHPLTFNFMHEIVLNLAGIPIAIMAVILLHLQAGLNTVLNNYVFWLGLTKHKNIETLNPNRFSAKFYYFAKVLAACLIIGPSMLILAFYQVQGFAFGLLHGTNLSQTDWRNRRIKALSRFSHTLGFVFTDTINGFFLGLYEGFGRMRNFAYQIPSANYIIMQTGLSHLSYRLGHVISGLLGLISLLSFDVLILGSLEIINWSLKTGYQLIYPNRLANTKLTLQTWQKLNPIWGLTPVLLILSASVSFSLRITLSIIIGSLQGIAKGLTNEFPQMNLLSSPTYIDALFNLIAQTVDKVINLALIFVLYATAYNSFRHFAQGILLAFDQILPTYKLEKDICRDLNPLEKYNILSRTAGIFSGFILGLGVFFSARLGFSTLKGMSYGFINGIRLSLYLPPLLNEKATHDIDKAFNFLADGLETSLSNLIQGFSQVVFEGIIINPIRLTLLGLQNGLNDIAPSKRIFLIDDKTSDLKITHIFTYLLGYPSYFIAYNIIFISIASGRFIASALNGILYGLTNGLLIGYDVKVSPFEKKSHEHSMDEFFYQNFKVFTALSLYIGMPIGSVAYNFPAMLAGMTYFIQQLYADMDSVRDGLDFNHTHKPRGFLGFSIGSIVGLILTIPLFCVRLLGNSIISFYYRFMEIVALGFQGSHWQEKLKPNDTRTVLARKFGIPGNVGLFFGLLAFVIIVFIRNVPIFLYLNFKHGFLNGLNPWLNLSERYKINSVLNFIPHVLGRITGNLIGFSYQNIVSLGWLMKQIIDLAYFDKQKFENTNSSSLNSWQKWPGRTLAGLLYIPAISLLAPIWTWRLVQSNCLNLIFSLKKGYQMLLGLNPTYSGFEKILSLPSYMIGFTLGLLVMSIEQGLRQLAKLPRLLMNDFRHGLHLGLQPFVDETNLIEDKPYQYLGLPFVATGLIIGLIMGILNNTRLATRYVFNLAKALAYFDKDAKCDDDFANKSSLRQVIGHLTTLPFSLVLIPSILLSLNAWRFVKMNVLSIPQGLNDGYKLKTSQNTAMSRWEAFLSLPFYSISFVLGTSIRGLKFISIDGIFSTFNGIFAGFRLIDRNYPARYLQNKQVATSTEDKRNPIAFYALGLPIGTLLKFMTNIASRNLENIIISSGLWYQLLWADKLQHTHNNPSYFEPFALPGMLLGHLFGFIYFNLRGMCRVVFETIRGFTHGITNNLLARNDLNAVETILATPGFYLGLGLNQLGNGVIETIMKTLATAILVSILPYGISDFQAFKPNGLAQGLGVGLGCVLGVLPLVLVSSYRFIKENIKSLKAIPSLLMKDEYPLEPGRQYYEQYGIGFIAAGLGYIAFTCKYLLLVSISSFAYCIIAAYKLVTMIRNPRFNPSINQTLGDAQDKFHHLYAELNNISRQFPETIPLKKDPCKGGKGHWAFIGKVIDFNNPSLTERMLDAVLAIFMENKRTPEDIRNTLSLFKPEQDTIEFDRALNRITTSLAL